MGNGMDYFTIYVAWAMNTPNVMAEWAYEGEPGFRNPGDAMIQPHVVGGVTLVNRYGGGGTASNMEGGARFAAWVVPVQNMLEQNMERIAPERTWGGYLGNPRIGKCTLPSVSWILKAVTNGASNRNHRNLNGENSVIELSL